MTTRREKAKAQKPQIRSAQGDASLAKNKQLEAVNAEEPKVKVNSKSRKEKLSNYMIDVSKYVLTGVVITSLFNDVTDKTMLYLTGIFIVLLSLTIGLVLTEKKKGN